MSPNPKNLLPADFARKLHTARELADAQRRSRESERFATACPPLDRLLDGGLPRGSMVELVGRRSSGRFSLVLSTLAAVTGCGEPAALVDLGDGFDPRAAEEAGVVLERLLWARPRRLKEAVACAEVILQSGMPLVVVELGMPPVPGGRGAEASWLRLARAAHGHRAALLVSSPYRASGTAAQMVLEARAPRARWHGQGAAPRLLRGISTCLELVKTRDRGMAGPRQGEIESLGLRVPADLGTPWHDDATRHRRERVVASYDDRREGVRAIA